MAKKVREQHLLAFRHAKAVGLSPGATRRSDLGRVLSNEGVKQAEALRAVFEASEGFTFDVVAASPAFRTLQTAAILGYGNIERVDGVEELERLLPPEPEKIWFGFLSREDARHINYLDQNIGLAPLRAYRMKEADRKVMNKYGGHTWDAIGKKVDKKDVGQKVLVVAHGILLAQTLRRGVRGRSSNRLVMQRTLENFVMEEAMGIYIQFENGKPVDLKTIRSPDDLEKIVEKISFKPETVAPPPPPLLAESDEPPAQLPPPPPPAGPPSTADDSEVEEATDKKD